MIESQFILSAVIVFSVIAALDLIVAVRILLDLRKSGFNYGSIQQYLERDIQNWDYISNISLLLLIIFSMERFLIFPMAASVILVMINLNFLKLTSFLLRRRHLAVIGGTS